MKNNSQSPNHSEEVEPKNLFLKVVLLGTEGTGKKSFIDKVSKLKNSNISEIPKFDETVTQSSIFEYSIRKDIIFSVQFFIPSYPIPIEHDTEIDSEEEENEEFYKKYKLVFTKTKKDIENIYSLYKGASNFEAKTIFIFFVDYSNFGETFDKIKIYFEALKKKLDKFSGDTYTILMASKCDKNYYISNNDRNNLSEFLKNNPSLIFLEESIKVCFDFPGFYINFLMKLSELFKENQKLHKIIEKKIKNIVDDKSIFSRAQRGYFKVDKDIPGAGKYYPDVYTTGSVEERTNLLNGNKKYTQKIFTNKIAPCWHKETKVFVEQKDPLDKYRNKMEQEKENVICKAGKFLAITKGVSMKGGEFEILKEERKKNALKRDELYYEAFNDSGASKLTNIITSRDNNNNNHIYSLTESSSRNISNDNNNNNPYINKKKNILFNMISSQKEKKQKYLDLVLINKDHIKSLIEERNIKILNSESFRVDKKKYLWKNNSDNVIETEKRINNIRSYNQYIKDKFMTPPLYNISKSLLDPNRGFSILPKRDFVYKSPYNEEYEINIKSSFDGIPSRPYSGSYIPRYNIQNKAKFVEDNCCKERFLKDLNIKMKRYENKRKNNEKLKFFKDFLNYRRRRRNEQKKEYQMIINGSDNAGFDYIDYMEFGSFIGKDGPKYSMGKRIEPKQQNNIFPYTFGKEKKNDKTEEPRFNYIKPSIVGFTFGHSQRFDNI